MTVYRLVISYDGTGFRGYARQAGVRTVQEELETALSTYLKGPVSTAVAGRTDAGVHARRQVASFQHEGEIELARLPRAINGILGPEVSVIDVSVAPDDFNARYSAVWRRYRYRMDMGPAPDPLRRHVVWHVGKQLDLESMTSTAEALVGEHDFSSFCRSAEGKSNVRRLAELSLAGSDGRLDFWVEANAFCHQMVRSMVGYLYDVGRGFSDPSLVEDVLASHDRSLVATVAPAHGLTLWDVGYD